MQVLLKHSEKHRDIECSVCKQSFRIYWERSSEAERATMRAIVQGELVRHHDGKPADAAAHPVKPFNVPEWTGDPKFSSAALLGGLSGVVRTTPSPRHSR